ncbi:dentin sialophosphoprotein-like isoform X1 [Ctenocephalides felis]|uniref:dentin sialophosphoprotein-like isoform X1 n=1 Tax=Ctenocephalides felis TaxID=7515 RepID=UPI000E6E4759|nr:dentin sialophosphoprotein-like isoform X1 [Ctenocephalides felis]
MPRLKAQLSKSKNSDTVKICSLCTSEEGVFTTLLPEKLINIYQLFQPDMPENSEAKTLCHRCIYKITVLEDFKKLLECDIQDQACVLCGGSPHSDLDVAQSFVDEKIQLCHYINRSFKSNDTICSNCYFKLELFKECKKYASANFVPEGRSVSALTSTSKLASVKKLVDRDLIKVNSVITKDKKMYTLIARVDVISNMTKAVKRKLGLDMVQGTKKVKVDTAKVSQNKKDTSSNKTVSQRGRPKSQTPTRKQLQSKKKTGAEKITTENILDEAEAKAEKNEKGRTLENGLKDNNEVDNSVSLIERLEAEKNEKGRTSEDRLKDNNEADNSVSLIERLEDTTASTSNTADDEIGIADENKITKNEDDKSSGGNDVDKDIGVPEKKPRNQIKIKLISPTKKKKNAKNKVQRQTKANKKVDVVLMDCKVLLESNMLADVPAQIQTELIESTNKNMMETALGNEVPNTDQNMSESEKPDNESSKISTICLVSQKEETSEDVMETALGNEVPNTDQNMSESEKPDNESSKISTICLVSQKEEISEDAQVEQEISSNDGNKKIEETIVECSTENADRKESEALPIENEVPLSVKITDEESKSEKKSKHVEFDLSNLDTPHDDQDNKDAKKETTEIFSVNASPELKDEKIIIESEENGNDNHSEIIDSVFCTESIVNCKSICKIHEEIELPPNSLPDEILEDEEMPLIEEKQNGSNSEANAQEQLENKAISENQLKAEAENSNEAQNSDSIENSDMVPDVEGLNVDNDIAENKKSKVECMKSCDENFSELSDTTPTISVADNTSEVNDTMQKELSSCNLIENLPKAAFHADSNEEPTIICENRHSDLVEKETEVLSGLEPNEDL